MWHDGEIDMEELEARLYSQVYHPNEEEIPACKPNMIEENVSFKPQKRYFEGEEIPQSPYGGPSIHRVYQRHPNNHNISQHHPTMHYPNSTHFYDQMGLFGYPAVNNIVVLPQPPAHIFAAPPVAEQQTSIKRKRSTIKRRERRRRRKEKWNGEKLYQAFKKNILTHKKVNLKENNKAFKKKILTHKKVNLKENNDNITAGEPAEVEIICVSESEDSDCEIKETPVPAIVLSSDDEMGVKESLQHAEIKSETKTNDSKEEFKSKGIEDNGSANLVEQRTNDDDDDVIFLEPQREIVTICDEPQSLTDTNSSISENDATISTLEKVSNQVHLDTPESTNDFLDNSFNSTQNGIDVSNQKISINDFESDSNFSASDFDGPSGSGIFTVQEFDVVPSKNSFSELNLDSFTDYIASKPSTSIPSILTPKRSTGNLINKNKSKGASFMNSSDSSSESDYEDVQNSSNNKQTLRSKTSSSGSDDDCVINDDCNDATSKGALPNLSPITSDEEINPKLNKTLDTKQKKKQKKKVIRVSGEKRKSGENIEALTDIKRIKQSKSSDLQETHKYFSSSDSEIEVVRIDNKSPTSFDVELLNVGSSSTPIKQLWNNEKRKRFSDYWTEDMRKFYHESWGHENFNVEEEQKSMSDDPTMWKIINNDAINCKLLPRGPRCYRCREFGHRANNCGKIIAAPKCILCGASGHLDARCPNKMCTSCGRRSYYSTTYCSRCANSRHVMCKICLMRGHSASYCTDLWRRYHLTRENGPLKQPNDSNLKPSKDRWCSGCATRGHFEFNCDYYNRTHAPVAPVVHSYEDVYENHRPTGQTDNSSQPQGESGYYPRPGQVSPWIIGCQPYDQRLGPNFIQNHTSNPNVYQQFSVFQSIPSLLDLQLNLNNLFYPNPELMSTSQNICMPNTNRAENERNLVAEILPHPAPDLAPPPTLGENEKRDFLKLNCTSADQLKNRGVLEFLEKISNDTNLKIKIIKRKKKKKFSYWCMLQGPQELLLTAKESIKNHFEMESEKSIDVMKIFQGKHFKMQILQENIAKLDNCNIDWSKIANKLYYRITRKKLGEGDDLAEKSHRMQKAHQKRYIALNSILIGKVGFAGGHRHMKILREGAANSNKFVVDKLIQSYNYVFKNHNRLDENYNSALQDLLCHDSSKKYIHNLFQAGCSLCKDDNMQQHLHKLKYLYQCVIFTKFSRRNVERFKTFYNKIRGQSEK